MDTDSIKTSLTAECNARAWAPRRVCQPATSGSLGVTIGLSALSGIALFSSLSAYQVKRRTTAYSKTGSLVTRSLALLSAVHTSPAVQHMPRLAAGALIPRPPLMARVAHVAALIIVTLNHVSAGSRVTGRDKVAAVLLNQPLPATCLPAPASPPPPLDSEGPLVFLAAALGSLARLPPGSLPAGLAGSTKTLAAVWNAMAPLHPSANPIPTPLPAMPRRPSAEFTATNRNTAIVFAALRAAESNLSPAMVGYVTGLMGFWGLDPAETCTEDLARPACIGNRAAAGVIELLRQNGANADGCVDTQVVCGKPFDDYTRYVPVNNPYKLKDIYAWQPLRETNGVGNFWAQENYFPFWGRVTPIVLNASEVARRRVEYRRPSRREYKAQVDEVLAASASLGGNDTLKALAELFDEPGAVGAQIQVAVLLSRQWDAATAMAFLLQFVVLADAAKIVIKEKARHNTVRPLSAVRHVYGDNRVMAYAGLRLGTTLLPGNEWVSYLRTSPEPEFPSGAVCACVVLAEWIEVFTGSNSLAAARIPVRQGCSFREPGATPGTNLTLSFATTGELVRVCQRARVMGGGHFVPATEASVQLCSGVAQVGLEWVRGLLPTLQP